jgi:toxin ParE1/3/4
MRLRFSERARTHLLAIKTFWRQRSPSHADHIGWSIHATTRLLRDVPYIGHAGTVDGTRELIVRGLPYVIVYQIGVGNPDDVMVLAVFHTAQDR